MRGLSNRWCVLALLFLVGNTMPLQFQAVAALAPFLVAGPGLSYTDIGVLTGLFMFPGIFLAAPAGMLAAWAGDRLALAAGLVLMAGSGLLFASTESYSVMMASRLLGGAGAVVINVVLPKIVTDWFMGKEIATALAIHAVSFGLGIGVAMALLPLIAEFTSWQVALQANAGLAVVAMVLLLVLYRDHGTQKAGEAQEAQEAGEVQEARDSQAPGPKKTGARRLWHLNPPEFVLSSIAGLERGLLGTGYVVFMSFLPPLLIMKGMAATEAGLLTSVTALVSLFSVPLGGYLTDRTGKPTWFIVGGSLSVAAVCFIVPQMAPALIWVCLFGALRGGVTGGIMALPSEVLRPESRTTGFSVVSGVFFISMAALPPVAGYLLDATGNTAAPIWFAGLLWVMIPVMLGLFRLLQRLWISGP